MQKITKHGGEGPPLGKKTSLFIAQANWEALRRYVVEEGIRTGTSVTMTDVINEALERFFRD